MKAADDKPEIGTGSCMLGVRNGDILRTDGEAEDGPVGPGKEGLSVNGCVRTIGFNFIPTRLGLTNPNFRGAKGKNSHKVWAMGEGDFQKAKISPDLELLLDGDDDEPGHGVLEASRVMELTDFQDALAATQDQWSIDENHPNDCPICRRYGIPQVDQTTR